MSDALISNAPDAERMKRAVHLTTVHAADDTRIYDKQLQSLAANGWDTHLIAHHDHNETRNDVHIHSLGDAHSRPERWRNIPTATRIAARLDADIYQFHDPELLPAGLYLTERTDGAVIFDIHEDYSRAVTSRDWVPRSLRPTVSRIYPVAQSIITRQFDALITVTDPIADRLRSHGQRVEVVRNYPRTSTLPEVPGDIERDHEYVLAYSGGLSEVRGMMDMLQVLRELRGRGLDVALWAVGNWMDDTEVRAQTYIDRHDLAEYVRFPGYLAYQDMFNWLASADVGVALLDINHYREGLPTKLFEYMFAGIPVVGTRVDATDLLDEAYFYPVPEHDTVAQADTFDQVLQSDTAAAGQHAHRDVEQRFSWEQEAETLLALYRDLV